MKTKLLRKLRDQAYNNYRYIYYMNDKLINKSSSSGYLTTKVNKITFISNSFINYPSYENIRKFITLCIIESINNLRFNNYKTIIDVINTK